jgi:hypothetical protein
MGNRHAWQSKSCVWAANVSRLAQSASSEREWNAFVRGYRREMHVPDNARLLDLLAALSQTSSFSVGCYCENPSALPALGLARPAARTRREAWLNSKQPGASRGMKRGIMSKATESPLLAAARSLTDDLSRFETLSEELSRLSIDTEKSLQRARQGLEACAEHETRLAESLRAFAVAMQAVQLSQQRCMELTAQAAAQVQLRQEQRAKLQERLALLGQSAREVSTPVAELFESAATPTHDMLPPLQEVERRLDAVISEAAELCELARRDDWADLQRDTQSLREQLQAVRNRVLLMRRKLAGDAPS